MRHIERFAPSPTGPLHLGHAFSAITAWNNAQKAGGDFLLRIEDIDKSRARPAWEELIYDDLRWLGLKWSEPVMRQSDRMSVYRDALETLWAQGLIYPCYCSRRDILEALRAPQEGAPISGPDGLVYPGTCRSDPSLATPQDTALRLNIAKALKSISKPLEYRETGARPERVTICDQTLITRVGDVVLARKDMGTSYHLSVVLDDATQAITQVTRGEDLMEATSIHVLLQQLLGLPTPDYHHHQLIRDENGKRLAKRDDARAISSFREDGAAPDDIFEMIGLTPLAPT